VHLHLHLPIDSVRALKEAHNTEANHGSLLASFFLRPPLNSYEKGPSSLFQWLSDHIIQQPDRLIELRFYNPTDTK